MTWGREEATGIQLERRGSHTTTLSCARRPPQLCKTTRISLLKNRRTSRDEFPLPCALLSSAQLAWVVISPAAPPCACLGYSCTSTHTYRTPMLYNPRLDSITSNSRLAIYYPCTNATEVVTRVKIWRCLPFGPKRKAKNRLSPPEYKLHTCTIPNPHTKPPAVVSYAAMTRRLSFGILKISIQIQGNIFLKSSLKW